MGYQHRGMLAAPAEVAIGKLKPGGVTAPIRLLEGYAIFKLVERRPQKVHSLDEPEARARALELYKREMSERQWAAFNAMLRRSADVRINETVLTAAGNAGGNH